MKNTDYPSYFQAGDKASLNAQLYYTNYVRVDLILIVISSLLTIYNCESENSKLGIYIITGLMMLVAIIFSFIIKNKQYEDIWYKGRALAESCKTLTWRYMTCSEYFEKNLPEELVNDRFIDRVKEINEKFKDIEGELNAKVLSNKIISDEMKRIRNLSLEDRKEHYLKNRIESQIKWYYSKAGFNKKKYEICFYIVIASQILALISLIILIKVPNWNFNLVGFFSTLTASVFSWLQMKRFQENKQAYTTATAELNLIKEEFYKATTEDKFSKFVLDSENAMSREHTLWLAQKRN